MIAFHNGGDRNADAAELNETRRRSLRLEWEQFDRRRWFDAALNEYAVNSLVGEVRRCVEEVHYLGWWLYSIFVCHGWIQEPVTRRSKTADVDFYSRKTLYK